MRDSAAREVRGASSNAALAAADWAMKRRRVGMTGGGYNKASGLRAFGLRALALALGFRIWLLGPTGGSLDEAPDDGSAGLCRLAAALARLYGRSGRAGGSVGGAAGGAGHEERQPGAAASTQHHAAYRLWRARIVVARRTADRLHVQELRRRVRRRREHENDPAAHPLPERRLPARAVSSQRRLLPHRRAHVHRHSNDPLARSGDVGAESRRHGAAAAAGS